MPMAPKRPCTSPGCPERVTAGRCDKHRQHADRQRLNRGTTLYGPMWPAVRLDYLQRHPECVLCGRLANVADHHPRGIRLLIKLGDPDPHRDANLRALCWPCHSRETARTHPAGWHRR